MTTFTMRYIKGHFVVTGPDVPPMQFITSRRRSRRYGLADSLRATSAEIIAAAEYSTHSSSNANISTAETQTTRNYHCPPNR